MHDDPWNLISKDGFRTDSLWSSKDQGWGSSTLVWESPCNLNPGIRLINLDRDWPIMKLHIFLRGPHEKEAIKTTVTTANTWVEAKLFSA